MIRTILDTDIGTDVDDCLALGLMLGSPEFAFEGICTVYGDVELRARMVAKLLRLRGASDVPIRLGTRSPLLGIRPIHWEGHEGEGLLDPADAPDAFSTQHAVDFLVETVTANPGEIHILAIGPLTNIALAFLREPGLAKLVRHLTIMGGVLRGPRNLGLPYAEHNIVCDPEAAHVVLASGAPITLVPLDVTTRVNIRRDDIARLRAVGDPFHDAVAAQVERYPRFARQGSTNLHDPLAAAVVVDPTLVELTPLHVEVETLGRFGAAVTFMRKPDDRHPANAAVATDVDVERAEAFVLSRLLA